jgi:hypothetical protein
LSLSYRLCGFIKHAIQFYHSNHFLRSDGVLVIHSENWKANQNKHLNVEFDGFKYAKSGKPTEKDNLGNQVWHFRISEHHPPKTI